MLDELWSAQYLAPGTLCAFAGEMTTAAAAPSSLSSLSPSTDFTHALHMRFANPAAATAFICHQAFSAALERAKNAAAAGGSSEIPGPRPPLLVVFSARVDPPSLETLFRRGPEWEAGIEHALLLSDDVGQGEGREEGTEGGGEAATAAADLYVSQLRELAESSLVGAVQSTSGRVVQAPSSPSSSSSPPHSATHAILTRFAGPEQLRAFLALPPIKALLSPLLAVAEGEAQGESAPPPTPAAAPVRVVASAQYIIAPAQGVTGKQGA